MALADRLKPLVHRIRAIPGRMGLHPFRVYVVVRTWTGSTVGDGTSSDSETELLESGQPPHLESLGDEEVMVANLGKGSVKIGPLTPEHTGGGLDIDTVQATLTAAQERWIKVTGPGREDGERFRITDVDTDSALHYTITAAPLAEDAS